MRILTSLLGPAPASWSSPQLLAPPAMQTSQKSDSRLHSSVPCTFCVWVKLQDVNAAARLPAEQRQCKGHHNGQDYEGTHASPMRQSPSSTTGGCSKNSLTQSKHLPEIPFQIIAHDPDAPACTANSKIIYCVSSEVLHMLITLNRDGSGIRICMRQTNQTLSNLAILHMLLQADPCLLEHWRHKLQEMHIATTNSMYVP